MTDRVEIKPDSNEKTLEQSAEELKNITCVFDLLSFRFDINENSSIAFIILSIFSGVSVQQKH